MKGWLSLSIGLFLSIRIIQSTKKLKDSMSIRRYFTFYICIFSLLLIGSLQSCSEESDVDDRVTIGTENDGVYIGDLTTNTTTQDNYRRKVAVKKDKDEHVNLLIEFFPISEDENVNIALNDILASIEIYNGPVTLSAAQPQKIGEDEYTLTLDGSIIDKVLKFNAVLDPTTTTTTRSGQINIEFEGTLGEDLSSEALILGFELDSEYFIPNSSKIDSKDGGIRYCITKSATSNNLKSVLPIIRLSGGATISPTLDIPQDFSKPVTYVVTSQDKIFQKKYTITQLDRPEPFSFDNWIVANPLASHLESEYYTPNSQGGFSFNSNNSLYAPYMYLEATESTDPSVPVKPVEKFGVLPSSDSHTGAKAVSIETLKMRPSSVYNIPAIMGGSFYTGNYNEDVSNPANATTYGYPVYYKPLSIKGFFKYQRGSVYELCTNIENPYETIPVSDVFDSMQIRAVVYSVSNIEDESEMLTLAEILNGSSKIIAEGVFTSGDNQASYKEFEVLLNYAEEKPFNYGSYYRVAVLFWSSSDWYLYSGAPGSRLLIDDVEIITE